LLEFVDEDQLHHTLGGTNQSEINKDIGPWNEFEIVDGT